MRPTHRTYAAALALVASAAIAPRAGSQEPTGLYASPWPLAPNPQLTTPSLLLGEPSQAGALPPWLASAPLRLSLQAPIFPRAGGFPNCTSREEASGNAFNGLPVQRYTFIQLTPPLMLHGFSSAGCPIDGAIGAGVTYSAPLGDRWWLVGAAGAHGVPPHDWLRGRVAADLRVDVMKQLPDATTVTVGVGRRGLTFGGSF